MVRKIGILTGGGDCPGLNAVIRAVYKTLKRECECELIGIMDGFDGLISERFIHMTPESVRGILTLAYKKRPLLQGGIKCQLC